MNVLVTRTSAYATDALIRLLRRITSFKVNVYGCDMLPYEMNSSNQIVDKFYITPALDNPIQYIHSINKICQECDIDIVIPTMDDEIRVYTEHLSMVNFNVVLPPKEVVDLFHNKMNASIAVQQMGVPIPPIITDLRGKSKVIFRNKIGIGSSGVYIVDLKTEQYIQNRFQHDIFIQEYVDGDEYTVDVLADKNGKPHIIIPRKRLTIINGISYRCQLENAEKLINISQNIYSNFCIPGLSNVQFIVKNNEPYFIELNTRFAASGVAGILGSYNYIAPFLKHFVLGDNITPYSDNMSSIAWGSIITRHYGETISKFK